MKLLGLLALCTLLFRLSIDHWPRLRDWSLREESDEILNIAYWCDFAVVLILAMMVIASSPAEAAPGAGATPHIPVRADGYSKLLEREAVGRFGLNAPVALLAAQLHQESGWRTDAQSPYAQGLAQFTPATAKWIPEVCADLGTPNVWDARWSIRAQACYMRHLHAQVADAATPCDRWAMALSAYNGGLGWLNRDRKLASANGADRAVWFSNVELHSKRAAWAIAENRGYPRRILTTLEPTYLAAGWPGSRTCPAL